MNLQPKKGLDCGHGNGSQQRRPNDEQTTETPFFSRCHIFSKPFQDRTIHIVFAFTGMSLQDSARKARKTYLDHGTSWPGYETVFFHLDFHFLNILQSNFSQLPFTHLPMALLGTKLLQFGFSFKLTGLPCYHLSISPQRKVNERSAAGTKTWLCFLWGRLLFHPEVTFSLTTALINHIFPGILSFL